VVDKFVLQLEAQLADRNVTIELSDEARVWLVEHGYDETMGARPMARLIQATIKTPLADEVLFGKLKGGGAVRVVVVADEEAAKAGQTNDKLGFEFPEGPVAPKPEKEIEQAAKRAKRKPRGSGGGSSGRSPSGKRSKLKGFFGGPDEGEVELVAKPIVRTVPKVPLVKE
jgi:ATP-dependent Clp protease ATP-binding subunit ClpA